MLLGYCLSFLILQSLQTHSSTLDTISNYTLSNKVNLVAIQICGVDECSKDSGDWYNFGPYYSFLARNCYCDKKCVTFKDCCQDSLYMKKFNSSSYNLNYTCHPNFGLPFKLPVYMYSACPLSWTNDYVRQQCQSSRPQFEDPIIHIPVYSLKNVTTYRNIFCAVCNNELGKDLISWKINIKCQLPSNQEPPSMETFTNDMVYNSTTGEMFGYFVTGNHNRTTVICSLFVTEPEVPAVKVRYCKHTIDTCAQNWTSLDIANKCKIINAYRYYSFHNSSTIIYKNKYCARCNYINESELACQDKRMVQYKTFRGYPNSTYSFFLDTAYDNGTKLFCPLGTILDPFMDNCRKIICLSNESPLCDQHLCRTFSSSGYRILSNRAIYIPNLDKMYQFGDYHQDFNGTIIICEKISVEKLHTNKSDGLILTKLSDFEINTIEPLPHKDDDFCIRIALQHWEIETDKSDMSFYVPMLNATFKQGEYELDQSLRPIICDKVHIFYSGEGNDSCWKITLKPWAYKFQNNSLFVDMLNKSYALGQYSTDKNGHPQVCFSINLSSAINSTCVKMIIPPAQYELKDNMLYIRKFNKTYSADQYQIDHDRNISVCLSSMTLPCARMEINEEDYQYHENNSIYISFLNKTYLASEYELSDRKALICIPDGFNILSEPRFAVIEGYVTIVGLSISILSLILHLIAFCVMPDLRNLPGKNLASLAFCLLMAQLLWILRQPAIVSELFCVTIGISVHFLFLASFSWMGVISFDVWGTFTRRQMQNLSRNLEQPRFLRYSIFAWGLAFIVTCIATLMNFLAPEGDYVPMYVKGNCWIHQRKSLLVFFALPLAFILILNLIFFLMTTCSILSASNKAKKARSQDTHNVFIYCRLAIIMGLTWIVGFIPINELRYVFIIMNSLQGVFIFLSFTCNKKTRNGLRETFAKLSVRRTLSNTTTTTRMDDPNDNHRRISASSSQAVNSLPYPKISLNPKTSSPI